MTEQTGHHLLKAWVRRAGELGKYGLGQIGFGHITHSSLLALTTVCDFHRFYKDCRYHAIHSYPALEKPRTDGGANSCPSGKMLLRPAHKQAPCRFTPISVQSLRSDPEMAGFLLYGVV